MKNIIKEVIIILLLLIAIILLAGIVFYDYNPTSKIVPAIEQYEVPQNIEEELKNTVDENQTELVITYNVDESDLKKYEKSKDYVKGKVNPFADTSETTDNNINANNITTNGNINTNTNKTPAKNTTSSNVGIK